jgi:hypothetical protein
MMNLAATWTNLGDMDHVAKGLARVAATPVVPALSTAMLALLAGLLLLVGCGRTLISSAYRR